MFVQYTNRFVGDTEKAEEKKGRNKTDKTVQ